MHSRTEASACHTSIDRMILQQHEEPTDCIHPSHLSGCRNPIIAVGSRVAAPTLSCRNNRAQGIPGIGGTGTYDIILFVYAY